MISKLNYLFVLTAFIALLFYLYVIKKYNERTVSTPSVFECYIAIKTTHQFSKLYL
jgi:hypothetical protein